MSLADLAPFADLGTLAEITPCGFSLMRNGYSVSVEIENDGYSIVTSEGRQRCSGSAAVLASPIFADLARIAQNQAVLLSQQRMKGPPVPISIKIDQVAGAVPAFKAEQEPWKGLDCWLRGMQASQKLEGTDLLLIEGPAGVGKTTIVRETALLRAETFDGSTSLILQIISRGRVLQNIGDLIAFTLQDVRSNLTINQLKSLIRHGLITLAIDGFDELSDPNGFKTAWSGLNSLIEDVRGAATFLLAGRETFVSTEMMLRQLTSFKTEHDRLATLSLNDPQPEDARQWLLDKEGWDYSVLNGEFVEPIFVKGSYALRPFFLDVIAREPEALKDDTPPASDLLSYLVDIMIHREGSKFLAELDPPNREMATALYEEFVGRFLEEVARDLAENQSESIAEDALELLATVAAEGLLPDDQIAAVAHRAHTVVFLAKDLRAGHVRFAHEQLLQHFLARETLRSVGDGETPRYVRRNLFGREALEVFGHVARGKAELASQFLREVRAAIAKPSRDRTNTNLAVLGIAAACATAPDDANLLIQGISVNELYFPFAAPDGITIRDTMISILYAGSADLRHVKFESGTFISTLEINEQTQLPLPMPKYIKPQTLVRREGTTTDPREIQSFFEAYNPADADDGLAWQPEVAELLGRIERYRTFWLGTNLDDTDALGRRIISHQDWPKVYAALQDLDLVTVKSRQVSGTRPVFIHFRQDVSFSSNVELFHKLAS
ncbi:ATP-binding protein [Novosphingobium sp. SL115]|uniref:ATP-binding protein n=1 Tax=Novosphingobium sp. SL115 TaxID=2995150 RepID=UPI0022747D7A|nr:ATP-binding protein [Novosphingobium sp. SL115]MCY1669958.1 ATP-binding protein [Novosphingobium sp. SL115]